MNFKTLRESDQHYRQITRVYGYVQEIMANLPKGVVESFSVTEPFHDSEEVGGYVYIHAGSDLQSFWDSYGKCHRVAGDLWYEYEKILEPTLKVYIVFNR